MGGAHEKARANIEAIRLLKRLESEDREATDDEKAALSRYVGWGGMAQIFESNYRRRPEWDKPAEELRKLLTDDEYESARASTPNAHFTSPMVIKAIWEGLQHMGLGKEPQILEPAVGVGHFLGLQPESLKGRRTGVELDSITARIAKKLYPDSMIFQKGFEETPLPDNYFDAVVGNVPFGDYAVHDPLMPKTVTRAIHDYFFAKSIEKLRPGGVMALITSRYTMDKQDDSLRKYLAERADLLGAIRLPNTAFKGNAGTEVTTDILFLKKRAPGAQPAGEAWQHLEPVVTPDGLIPVNEYFARHPDMMLGKMKLEGSMYRGAEPTLEGNLTPELLARAVKSLPIGAYVPKDEGRGPPPKRLDDEDFTGVKDGAYAEREGKIVIRNGNSFEPTSLSSSAAARVRAMIAVRDAVRLVFRTQIEDEPEERILQARKVLNDLYDSFVHRYGPLTARDNLRAFAGDPDQPLLLSLENYDAEHKRATKTAIFSKRTLSKYVPAAHVDTAAEALAISLNETGGIDWKRMASLTGHTAKEMQLELDGMVYRNPEGDWETADRYLSGNVRAKLKTAEAAATIDRSYQRNVEALKAIQPADLMPGDISARLGSSWIPPSDIKDFICETLGVSRSGVSVTHSGAIATWALTLDYEAKNAVSNTTTWGTPRATASALIEDALNGRTPTIYDLMPNDTRVVNQQETIAAREAQQKLKDKFSEWIWQDEARAQRLARYYNDTFNNIRLRTYDGSHLTFPEMNTSLLRANDLDKHQKDAVWRTIQCDNTLLAHCVGAGKAQPLDAKILTPTGWKMMGEIKVGDTVIAGDGTPTTVEAVFPQGEKDIFKVTFHDGSSTECCDEHLWLTQTYSQRNADGNAKRLGKSWDCAKPKVRSLSEIRTTLRSSHLNALNHSIPMVSPVEFVESPVPVDPYLLGVILGDGSVRSNTVKISIADEEIIERCRLFLPAELKLAEISSRNRCRTWSISRKVPQVGRSAVENPLVTSLKLLGIMNALSYDKHIPREYLFNSPRVRFALLQGLLDTDGTISKNGHSSYFYKVSARLAQDVLFLVQSFGGIVRIKEKRPTYRYKGELRQGVTCYSLCISLPPELNPFQLRRKADKVIPKSSCKPVRYIKDVQPVGRKPAQCIRVAHPSHLYVTDDFIITHNTAEITAACMEMKRLGIAQKPMIVVPNHLVEQWGAAFLALYPQAHIFVAGKDFFTTGNRQKAMARIATGNYDAVIVAHGSFERLPVSDETFSRFVGKQIDKLEDAIYEAKAEKGDNRSIVKDLEKSKKRLEAKLKERADRDRKDDAVTFEQLGVDRVFVDESDAYKNLGVQSKMTRIAGISNTESNRALDMYMKTQYLAERGGGIIFATGTPISNTMAEMYTLQRYLAPETLKAAGVEHFDAWAANFGEAVTALELAPDGSGYRMHTRFAKFVNLPELLSMFRSFADVQTADMLHLPRPEIDGGKPHISAAPASPQLKEYVGTLVERAQKLRGSKIDPRVDNMLKITGDGRKAALDMRLVGGYVDEGIDTKISKAINRIYDTWQSTRDKRSTQLVFCDLSTPNPDKFNVYDEVREKLMALGIPEKEIAFIHGELSATVHDFAPL